jgi:hypothetical protein
MKPIILLVLLSLSGAAFAQQMAPYAAGAPPSIVADVPNPAGVADCVATPATCAQTCIYHPSSTAAPVESPVLVDNAVGIATYQFRICRNTAASATPGTNTVTFQVRDSWGGVSANSAPFSFVRPATPIAPAGLRLVQ